MAEELFEVKVDADKLERTLAGFERNIERRAVRKGLTDLAKYGRAEARGLAAQYQHRSAISYRVRSRRGLVSARVYIKSPGFMLRFLTRGTPERTTQSGASRGSVEARGFMQAAADKVDSRAKEYVDNSIGEARRLAGL